MIATESARSVGKAFNRVSQIEAWVRRAAGVVLVLVGIHLSLKYAFEIVPFRDPWLDGLSELWGNAIRWLRPGGP